jgi:hypothetical protein
MFLTLVLLKLTIASIMTSPLWYKRLIEGSPNYTSQLYCGTVARGRLYMDEIAKGKPVDTLAFIEGVEEVVKQNSLSSHPTLTKEENRWIRAQVFSIWKEATFGSGTKFGKPLVKMFLKLLVMRSSKSNDETVNLAVLLKENKGKKILTSEEIKKRISYLRQFPASPDPACEDLRSHLLESLENFEFIIPDYPTLEETKKAINHGIKFFTAQKVSSNPEATVLSFYLYVQLHRFKYKASQDNFQRMLAALDLLRENFEKTRQAAMWTVSYLNSG